ncbi:hypothetical protein OESDEN_04461 [Oesophagostomum dentatum]|uniref:Uncharacterized protein n=1 Tax=Oesophagostomum dentatum TaxID=61180 RepID=A0A0B1TE93_OESDE|nr:hypothetical protein OESDEN_04461 [Oesophagostomum dentatum]
MPFVVDVYPTKDDILRNEGELICQLCGKRCIRQNPFCVNVALDLHCKRISSIIRRSGVFWEIEGGNLVKVSTLNSLMSLSSSSTFA